MQIPLTSNQGGSQQAFCDGPNLGGARLSEQPHERINIILRHSRANMAGPFPYQTQRIDFGFTPTLMNQEFNSSKYTHTSAHQHQWNGMLVLMSPIPSIISEHPLYPPPRYTQTRVRASRTLCIIQKQLKTTRVLSYRLEPRKWVEGRSPEIWAIKGLTPPILQVPHL